MDVEPPHHRLTGKVGLELLIDVGFLNGTAAVGTKFRQRGVVGFIHALRCREGAVAVPAMPFTGPASGFLGLLVGRPFGERGGLAFGAASGLVAIAACLVEFEPEAFVVAPQLFDQGAQLLQLFQDGERYGYRVADLDRCHQDLKATDARPVLLRVPTSGKA
jgi:hypothetical protein